MNTISGPQKSDDELAWQICDYLAGESRDHFSHLKRVVASELLLLLLAAAEVMFFNCLFNGSFYNNVKGIVSDPSGKALPIKGKYMRLKKPKYHNSALVGLAKNP